MTISRDKLEAEVRKLRLALADDVLDHKIDEAAPRLMCRCAGATPEEVKKEWWGIAHDVNKENEDIPITKICGRFGKSTVAYYKSRKARARIANKEDFILLLAKRERMVNPMSGCKNVLFAILKVEYFLDRHFKTKAEAHKAIAEATRGYNHRRLHGAWATRRRRRSAPSGKRWRDARRE